MVVRIYIADDEKLTKFDLPQEIRESFLVPYKMMDSKKEYLITVEGVKGKWQVKSNGSINVIENSVTIMDSVLNTYIPITCEVVNEKKMLTICLMPTVDENSLLVSLYGTNNITIGSSPTDNIFYQGKNIIQNHVIMYQKDGKSIIKASSTGVYLNSTPINTSYLNIGDVIFLYGLKIIYMGNFLKLNNPNGIININGMQPYVDLAVMDNSNYEKTNSSESDIELYDEVDYFFHKPRIKNILTTNKVEIDAPPAEDKVDNMPAILTIGSSLTMSASSLMMGYSVIYGMSNGTRTLADSLPQIVMCVAMIIGSLIMPRITAAYQKNQKKKREVLRQKKYGEYLTNKEKEINGIIKKQISLLNRNFPNATDCANIIVNKDERLWERQIVDDDFLEISVGVGNSDADIEIQAPEKHFTLEEDNLREMVYKVVNRSRTLSNVPIVYSLVKNRISALIIDNSIKEKYMSNILLQLIALHSAADLKMVFLLNNENSYNYAKYFPHIWSEDKTSRYYSINMDEMKSIAEDMLKEFNKRKNSISSAGKDENKDIKKKMGYKNFSCYYLIITDCYRKIKDFDIINELLKADENYGFSLLFVDSNLGGIPPLCSSFIFLEGTNNYILEPKGENNITRPFSITNLPIINMELISGKLSNIPIMAKEGKAELPKSLTFLEMYNVSKIEQLNILNRWEINNPVLNLKTPIGVHADRELFILDLHEKAHGPHGLIAGSTGSGKSEFIITFVLSMAINFHPNEVQFVLIDYKGGGLAGAFENREKGICLPHLAGTITNLDTAEMNRTLVSINSELKRRQRKFNEVRDRLGEGTIDIYKYQKLYRQGVIKEPIAHLFIISDEFAELKSQQPEFMSELISTARIGRSLGVHLILATQKPSGVVNDQIWANSRFKVCLKVQDRGDSMEMLKRPDAASIKETGRFYLQVGYDEYFDIGQSGYSGAKYIPSDRVVKKVDDSINYINNIGNDIKIISDQTEEVNKTDDYGDQLTNIVKYIVNIAKKEKIKIKKLWLSSISEIIYIDELKDKYDYIAKPYQINPIIGEYDNPSAQTQGLLTFDLTNVGSALIYGISGSGKENLLTTLITSICTDHSPEEVNLYIMDFGAETLKIFNKFPQVGSIITQEDQDLMLDTLIMLEKECDRRKNLFIDYAGNYNNYINESGEKLPLLIIIINYYEIFAESNPKITEPLNNMIRDCEKYGLKFIVTTATNNSIRMRVAQLFKNKLSLQQNDPMEYRSLVGAPKGVIPKKIFGRGIVSIDGTGYEFQTAYISEKPKINATIREIASNLNQKYKTKAKSSARLPEVVTFDMLSSKVENITNVPIGYAEDTKEIYKYNFDKNPVSLILSNDLNKTKGFIYAINKMFLMIPNTEVMIVDTTDMLEQKEVGKEIMNKDFDNVLVNVIQNVNKEADGKKRIFIFYGFKKFKDNLSQNYLQYYNSLFENINRFKNAKILLVDNYDSFKKVEIENWYSNTINPADGIWIGNGADEQMLIKFNDMPDNIRKESFNDIAVICENGKSVVIKHVTVEAQNEQ